MAELPPADLPKLELKRAFDFDGVARARAQPTIVAGRLFVGSTNGKGWTRYGMIAAMKIVEAITGMTRTYTFVFAPEPEGGYTVTCPALRGLVTYGESLDEAREMARDAMEGLVEVMLEQGEPVPESDAPEAVPRFNRLAHTLHVEGESEPLFEQLSARIGEKV